MKFNKIIFPVALIAASSIAITPAFAAGSGAHKGSVSLAHQAFSNWEKSFASLSKIESQVSNASGYTKSKLQKALKIATQAESIKHVAALNALHDAIHSDSTTQALVATYHEGKAALEQADQNLQDAQDASSSASDALDKLTNGSSTPATSDNQTKIDAAQAIIDATQPTVDADQAIVDDAQTALDADSMNTTLSEALDASNNKLDADQKIIDDAQAIIDSLSTPSSVPAVSSDDTQTAQDAVNTAQTAIDDAQSADDNASADVDSALNALDSTALGVLIKAELDSSDFNLDI